MIIVAVVAVLLLLHSGGSFGLSLGSGALGAGPPPGGADGSPQAMVASNYAQTRPPGNSEQNIAHGLESAIGGGVAAGVCTYYGASAAAPVCAKIGSYLGPKAVALGNFTTIKSVQYAEKANTAIGTVITKGVGLGTGIANQGASYADRAYAGAGQIPGPASIVAKASIAPIKVVADLGAKGAGLVGQGAGALTSGVKSAGKATESAVKKVLGWL